MAYKVVLDADVLFPASLRDTLLRLAEIELFDPHWSDEILDEFRRNVIAKRPTVSAADMDRLTAAMNGAFEDALVDQDAIARILDSMRNDPKDRHVLAAAVVTGADGIVTNNIRHFPPEACDPYGITVATADEFLSTLFHIDPDAVTGAISRQTVSLRNPPHTLEEVLDFLERGGSPQFVALLQRQLGLESPGP